MDLSGRRVLLTGASRGIGRALASELAGAGASLALVARDRDALEEVAAALGAATVHPCDLADPAQVDGLVARVEDAGGPIDVLVNNAGLDRSGALVESGPEDVGAVFQVNLLTPVELCRQALPGMLDRGVGHLVNMSSLAGVSGFPGMAVYASTKAGLTHFTSVLRSDLRGSPVVTTLVEVGPVPTDMLDEIEGYEPTRRSMQRLRRLQLLPRTPKEAVAREVVAAVIAGRRPVRRPRRLVALAMLPEAPRRMTEALLTGIPHQSAAGRSAMRS